MQKLQEQISVLRHTVSKAPPEAAACPGGTYLSAIRVSGQTELAEADGNRTHRPLFAGHWF